MVSRIYVEKKSGFDVEAKQLLGELRNTLLIENLENLRLINRYDVEGISDELFEQCVTTVFSEPQSDDTYRTLPEPDGAVVFGVEALPGQFDQRSASAGECIQLISQGERPEVHNAKIYILEGPLTSEDVEAIKHYVINPVETREASLDVLETLKVEYPEPAPVEIITGFINLDEAGLAAFLKERGLAMDLADLKFCQQYFIGEKRDPTITEIKVVDTYWSDHCRHTTFGTVLDNVEIDDDIVQAAFDKYLVIRHELGRDEKPICLMDMGTIGAKYLKAKGQMENLDESEEVNACTVKVKVDVNGTDEDWLFLFKNETHNHPTEIEPFGGAATCVGGAIRDPLSGRSYVYQAMRVTGAGDPTVPVAETIPGKLPQRKIVTTAASGYSSYGNQIGLATSQVTELYHPGYVAKRMEIGAVLGATPANHVRREEPAPGDVVVLLGGRTGRDGIGGATGSSKEHSASSVEECGAEVQKGNAPVERKIQRLFRRGTACRMIKRCNDFGAGGVSVSIGELADSLWIDLNRVPKKYDGLDGTELAISESQERMSVALAAEDVDAFIALATKENLEATPVAKVTDTGRVQMVWNDDMIVDLSRDFLASNGAPKHVNVHILEGEEFHPAWPGKTLEQKMTSLVTDLNVACNRGLSERFDATIGAGTVMMPFGGKRQLTPNQALVSKFPVIGETTTTSGMAWGFNPYLMEKNQFTGAYLSVVESVAKLVAAGFDTSTMYLSLQEYFEKLHDVPERWGQPAGAVLGALMAQLDLGIGAIGGKDSMSGSFEQLDVPPTLVSFAVGTGSVNRVMTPEFKNVARRVVRISPIYEDDDVTPKARALKEVFALVTNLIDKGDVAAVSTMGYGCTAEVLFKMCLGNRIGVALNDTITGESLNYLLFEPAYGSFIVELNEGAPMPEGSTLAHVVQIGATTQSYTFYADEEEIDLAKLEEAWAGAIEDVFPYRNQEEAETPVETISYTEQLPTTLLGFGQGKPTVAIPVFPGNNCEYDSALAFERAGAKTNTLIVNNLTPAKVAESTNALVEAIGKSQIIMIPGGFSGGDEPDGSAKFITAFFRAPAVTEAVRDLLFNRDGLILGICNGFQALVKLGLVPYGDIRPMDADCPTLTFNSIGRHQSRIVRTRVASSLSPWLSRCQVGDIHTMPISNGEGRFVANDAVLQQMVAAGQIATQYVNEQGIPTMNWDANPSGSLMAIEGITSPDGRVFGKMGHTERSGAGLYANFPGYTYQPIFEAGVDYFSC
ncbi:MAG: phosphoribosylformylglycinamidine synthase [Coriobacteriia bacterium]|nr:phosphoribosylformylglycinamidine synthase [Coriobacteriia bacterium]